jgi:hypothetical protein
LSERANLLLGLAKGALEADQAIAVDLDGSIFF